MSESVEVARADDNAATTSEPQSRGGMEGVIMPSYHLNISKILSPWEEAVGALHNLISDGGSLLAEIGPLTVFLPLELEGQLRPNVGKRIAILRTDDPIKPYRIRVPR